MWLAVLLSLQPVYHTAYTLPTHWIETPTGWIKTHHITAASILLTGLTILTPKILIITHF